LDFIINDSYKIELNFPILNKNKLYISDYKSKFSPLYSQNFESLSYQDCFDIYDKVIKLKAFL
jgi:hypothetical protein